MLQNSRVAALTVFELLRGEGLKLSTGGGLKLPSPPTQIRFKEKEVTRHITEELEIIIQMNLMTNSFPLINAQKSFTTMKSLTL